MSLIDFTTKSGQTIASADIADIVNHLQGASNKTEAWHFRVSSGNNYLITLSDAAGAQKFSIRDSAGVEQFSVDSDGNVTISGTFTPSSLTLPTASSPSQTTEGSIKWDSDDDRLTVGTGAATKVIGLSRGAGLDASATQELAYDTTAATLKVWDGSASQPATPLYIYGSNTTEATMTAVAITDLVTISSLNIPAGKPFRIKFMYRKTSGAAAVSTNGLKINSTTAIGATGTLATSLCGCSAANQAESGICVVDVFPGETNYQTGIQSTWSTYPSAGGALVAGSQISLSQTIQALIPTATVTSITITGQGNASFTNAVKNVYVEAI